MAELTESLGRYAGIIHGARLCEAEGVGADLFASLYPVGDRARELAEIVHAGDFSLGSLYDGATIRVWEEVVQRLQSQARDAKMSSEYPDNISGIFNREGKEQRHAGAAAQFAFDTHFHLRWQTGRCVVV